MYFSNPGCCCPGWGFNSWGNNNTNSEWIWAIIIVAVIIFFVCGSNRGNHNHC